MKSAEALAERSDCQNRIEEIKIRLVRSARVQEREQPTEDTTELVEESERILRERTLAKKDRQEASPALKSKIRNVMWGPFRLWFAAGGYRGIRLHQFGSLNRTQAKELELVPQSIRIDSDGPLIEPYEENRAKRSDSTMAGKKEVWMGGRYRDAGSTLYIVVIER